VVKDDERYQERGLKGIGVDVKQAWAKVLQKSNSSAARVKTMYKMVSEAVEELIRALGSTETKAIRIALADHHRVNRAFDFLGLAYPD
jgi:oligoribonuclease NrnB/cAMP/cGMP phosphodiesterase (DHH superfamily)